MAIVTDLVEIAVKIREVFWRNAHLVGPGTD
jgi:hypothetical protein